MKKKKILILLIILSCICTGCDFDKLIHGEVDFEDHPTYINVVVSGVDDGILQCKYVCEWKDSYAYYDQGVIYYFETANDNPIEIECPNLMYMAMNDNNIYFTQGTGLYAIDKNSMKTEEVVGISKVSGINIYNKEVVITGVYDSDITYYEVEGINIIKETTIKGVDVKGEYNYLSSNKNCANIYGSTKAYFYADEKIFQILGDCYSILGKKDTLHSFTCITDGPESSPEHIVEYNSNLYILLQNSSAVQGDTINTLYRFKAWDHLICFDPSTQASESIYKTVGPEEQIVNFSVENDELYLLIKGKLYKSNLKGENKKELADLSGIAPTLSFDYVNDTLFVYDGDKLLGQYK